MKRIEELYQIVMDRLEEAEKRAAVFREKAAEARERAEKHKDEALVAVERCDAADNYRELTDAQIEESAARMYDERAAKIGRESVLTDEEKKLYRDEVVGLVDDAARTAKKELVKMAARAKAILDAYDKKVKSAKRTLDAIEFSADRKQPPIRYVDRRRFDEEVFMPAHRIYCAVYDDRTARVMFTRNFDADKTATNV